MTRIPAPRGKTRHDQTSGRPSAFGRRPFFRLKPAEGFMGRSWSAQLLNFAFTTVALRERLPVISGSVILLGSTGTLVRRGATPVGRCIVVSMNTRLPVPIHQRIIGDSRRLSQYRLGDAGPISLERSVVL